MIRVLVVDDNDTHRLIARRWLESAGPGVYEVTEAGGAEDGFARVAADRPDCVLLDNIMAGADGFQTIHRMRRDIPDCPPIIFMTCALTEELRRNALALGAAGCFDKGLLAGPDLLGAVDAAVAAHALGRPRRPGRP